MPNPYKIRFTVGDRTLTWTRYGTNVLGVATSVISVIEQEWPEEEILFISIKKEGKAGEMAKKID